MLFDRQVLYLVFLFASTQAAPARNITTTSTTSTASLDDSPSLSLDISPQLISSAADFASQVVSAVFAEESSSNSSRGSTRHLLDDVSTSSESYPPVALQTTRTATPSDPKNPAVTSSTSTRRRSRTRLSSTSETAHPFALSISTRPTTTSSRPHSLPGTTEDQAISHHHTTRPRPTATHAVSVQAFHNSTGLNSTVGQDPKPANMTDATNTAVGLGGLFTAIRQVGAQSGSDPASVTDLATATDNSEPATTNALDILVSALPNSLAAPIQSQFSGIINPIESVANSFTSDLFEPGLRTSHTRGPPTTTSTSITSTSSSFTTTTTPTTAPTPLPPPTTTDANRMPTTQPSNTDTSAASATTTGHSAANPNENVGAIAGGVTGSIAGLVVIGLAGLFLWRRRRQGKAPFKRGGSKHSNRVYPEVAWLYDPDITPPRSRAGSGSGAHLIPAPRPGSVEIGGTPVLGGASPEMRPARPSSPLLAPVVRGSRDMVGSRSRSGSEVDFERLRPLSTLREETPRGSTS